LHWNELLLVGAFPSEQLPSKSEVFTTSSSYLNTLADLHIKHLVYQSNDSIASENGCRQKFLSRILLRKLASSNTLIIPLDNIRPFKLWCDDLGPFNILLDKNFKVTGVIDWEFIYTAPAEFACSPPWWLRLEKPE
jgi:hypothetical protein